MKALCQREGRRGKYGKKMYGMTKKKLHSSRNKRHGKAEQTSE
jgi:hypothetical protein